MAATPRSGSATGVAKPCSAWGPSRVRTNDSSQLAPPLRESPWVLGSEDPLIRIALHGLKGQLMMPAMGALDDQQLSGILTYVRRAWGHSAGAVGADTVARVRAASEERKTPWTREELSR